LTFVDSLAPRFPTPQVQGPLMARQIAYPLYVNLSASQVRKRLKGYGFGVRRVEAADRNQAVIIHTATGTHLRDLESLFADVISASSKEDIGTPIENLRNLGPKSAGWLREIDVHCKADLEELGPVMAYRLVKRQHSKVSWNLLWAMAAALRDETLDALSAEEKAKLRSEAEA